MSLNINIKKKEFSLNLKWYELFGWLVILGMFAFGCWGFYDGLAIGSAHAGWKFLLMFVIFISPGVAIMLLCKPRPEQEVDMRQEILN